MEKKKKSNTMNIILVFMGIILIVYVSVVLYLFSKTGCEPSTLTISVFGLMTGECGFMSWIKTTKERERAEKEKENQKVEEDDVIDCG